MRRLQLLRWSRLSRHGKIFQGLFQDSVIAPFKAYNLSDRREKWKIGNISNKNIYLGFSISWCMGVFR